VHDEFITANPQNNNNNSKACNLLFYFR